MGTLTAQITKMTSKITQIYVFLSKIRQSTHSCSYYEIPKEKWAAFRLVFLCCLEPFLQAECQRIANCVYLFERVGGSASHINIKQICCSPDLNKKMGGVPPCISMFFGSHFWRHALGTMINGGLVHKSAIALSIISIASRSRKFGDTGKPIRLSL